ncbi:unnamed protein product [Closterium sp. Naga37s-1]|nr:unnamed protein product [Closterium sp. Naga37s-1]
MCDHSLSTDGAVNGNSSATAAAADPPPTEPLPPSAAAAAAEGPESQSQSQSQPRLTHEQYSGLAEGTEIEKVVAARVRDTEGMLEALRSAAGSSFEDMALHREESRAHPEAFGQRDWRVSGRKGVAGGRERRLKEQSKSHRVMYRPGAEGTAFHELCLEGVLKGSLDTVLAVAWEAPFFADWWPQFSVPPFHMLESKFVKRVAPGYELVYLRFKVPWPFAPREILYVLFSVHDAATGFIATSLISVSATLISVSATLISVSATLISVSATLLSVSATLLSVSATLLSVSATLLSVSATLISVSATLLSVSATLISVSATLLSVSATLLSVSATLLFAQQFALSLPEDPAAFDPDSYGFTNDGVPRLRAGEVRVSVKGGFASKDLGNGHCYFRGLATIDVKLNLIPPWLFNFMSRQLAGSGYHMLYNEIESVADGSNKEADKFRALLRSDPFYYSVGRAMRAHHAAAVAQGERAKQEREQLQQQGEAESFWQIGERVEKEVERLVASTSGSGSVVPGGGGGAAAAGADGAAGGGDSGVMNAAEALAEVVAVPVPAAAGPPTAASPASVVRPPRPPSPRKLVAPASPAVAQAAAAAARAEGGLAAVGAAGENAAADSQGLQYGQLRQRDPAIFHAVTTLDRAISFMRARAAAAAAGNAAGGFSGLVPPKQEVWSYSGQLRPAPRQGESGGDGDAGETRGSGEGQTEERVWMLTRGGKEGEDGGGEVRGMAFFEARRSFDRALASDTWTDPAIVTRAVKRRLGLPEPEETAFESAREKCDAACVGGNGTQGEIENAAEMLEQIAAGAPSFGENGTQGDIENAAEMLEQIAAGAPSVGENITQGEIENAAEMLQQVAAVGSEATASNGATRAAQDGSGEATNGAGMEASDGEVSGWPLRSQTVQTAYHNSPDGATNNSNAAAAADPPPTEPLPPSAAAPAKGPESQSQSQPQPEPRLTHEQYSGLAEAAEMDKVVAERVRDTEGMLEALRSAAGSSFEDMALHREESRAHPEAFGQRDWRVGIAGVREWGVSGVAGLAGQLKEQSKSHRVMYRPGAEGTAFHELCLEGVLKGSLDTVLAVAWEAPYFIDWWPQSSVPPFHVLESKFVKRVAPGYEVVHVRLKVPWPFAQRDMLYVLFSVHDAATGFIATSLISVSSTLLVVLPVVLSVLPVVLLFVLPVFLLFVFPVFLLFVFPVFIHFVFPVFLLFVIPVVLLFVFPLALLFVLPLALFFDHSVQLPFLWFPDNPAAFDPDAYGFTSDGVPPVRSGEVRMSMKGGFAAKDLGNGYCYFRGVATIDMKLNLIPSWLINFVSRQLAGSGYHMLYREIESVADGSNKEADKFRALLLSDPFYYSVGRAMRSHHAAAAAQGERAKQEREQLKQQGEAESFRQIGERVETEVERLVASTSGSESDVGGAAAAGAGDAGADGAAGGDVGVINAAEALAEVAAVPVPAAAGPPKAASPASVVRPPRPPSPRKLMAPAQPAAAKAAAAAARAEGGLAAVGAAGENAAAGSHGLQYGQLQQRDPAIFHAVTTLDRAISFMRARAVAQRQAATAAAGSGAAGLSGLVPPKQEVWSYSGQLRPAPRQGESGGDGDAGETGGSGEGGTEERVWMLTRTISAGPEDHARGMAFFEARRSFDRALASDTWTDPAIVTRAVKRRLGLPEPEETAFESAREKCDAAFVGGNGTQGEIENASEMLEEIAAGAPFFGENGTQGDIENAAEMLEKIAAGAPSFGENGTLGEMENAAEMLEQIAAGAPSVGGNGTQGEVESAAEMLEQVAAGAPSVGGGSDIRGEQVSGEVFPHSFTSPCRSSFAPRAAEGAEQEPQGDVQPRGASQSVHNAPLTPGPPIPSLQPQLKEQSKSHRVMYRPGAEGTAFHELCLEGVLKGSLDTVLAVAWEAPFFIDWWPQFSVPPFHMLESKFVKRVAPGYELVHLRFKVPWPFATREILFVLFSVHDAATGFIATSLISYPDDPATFDPDSYGFSNDGVPRVRSGEVRMSVKGGFASKDLGNGCCYFRTWIISFHHSSRLSLSLSLSLVFSRPRPALPNVPPCNPQEVESVADGSNKEADKFRALLRSDPFYYSVGRAMRSHHAAAAAQGERARQEREQLQQQGEAESFRQIGERVEKQVERLVASTKLVAPAPAAAAQAPAAGTSPAAAARAGGGLAAVGAAGENAAAGSQGLQYGQLQQRDPAIFHAVTTLDRAISFMRARAAAQRQAATAAVGSGAAGFPGLVPPKQEVWSYSGQLRPAPRQGESGGGGGAGESGGSGEGGTEERMWMLTRTISAGPADHARGEGLGQVEVLLSGHLRPLWEGREGGMKGGG